MVPFDPLDNSSRQAGRGKAVPFGFGEESALCNLASLGLVHGPLSGPCGVVGGGRRVSAGLEEGFWANRRLTVRHRAQWARVSGSISPGEAAQAALVVGGALGAAGPTAGRGVGIRIKGPGGVRSGLWRRWCWWRRRRWTVNPSRQGLPALVTTGRKVSGRVRLSRCSIAQSRELEKRLARRPRLRV